MSDYIIAEKLNNKILPSLLKAELGSRHLPRRFVQKKIASAERIVLTRLHHGLEQVYCVVDEEEGRYKQGFEINHKVNIMSQVVIRGYFLFKCDRERKIVLYNPKIDDCLISPEIPTTKKTVDYVGIFSNTFSVLSLVLGANEVVEDVLILIFNSEFAEWSKVETKDLRSLKIRKPNDNCILIDHQLFFSAYLHIDDQEMDIDGMYEDVVVSFGLMHHNFKIYGLPFDMICFRHKRLIQLQGDLSVVVYNNLRTENFQIWKREVRWFKWHTSNIKASFWEKNEKRRNEYSVYLATSSGLLLLAPRSVQKRMKTKYPVNLFMYDPCKEECVTPLDISWTKLEKNSPILMAVDYEVSQ